ncbi:hypothetical protein Tco_1425673, partial [Tanacetum coccineum]
QPKKDVFTVYFNYDGFSSWPLKYCQGQMKELNDINFDKIAKLSLGARELKSTQDIADMLKVGYDNGNEIDMYVEHFGYDIMELAELERNEEQNHNSIESSDDEYYSSDDYEEIENVDFQTEGDESVVIKNISTQDPFLNKLCSVRIMFRGTAEHHETETPLVDPDENQIDVVNKLDEMAFRECMEEQAREQARIDAEQEMFDKEMREEREWEEKQDCFNPANFREDLIEEAPFNQAYTEDTTDVTIENINEAPASETTDVSAMVEDLSAPVVDKGKGKESVEDQANSLKKK